MVAHLTLMRGISGSGKSTLAEQMSDEIGAVIVSRDQLRESMFGSSNNDYYARPGLNQRENQVSKQEEALVWMWLKEGKYVILDNTNLYGRNYMRITNPLINMGVSVSVTPVECELEGALERNRLRAESGGRDVPEDVIIKQHDRMRSLSRNGWLYKVTIP